MIQNRKKDGLITTVIDLDAHIPDKTFKFLILINRGPPQIQSIIVMHGKVVRDYVISQIADNDFIPKISHNK